jgi:hypothetical protein
VKPRRLTPAEADALVAHLSPAERRQRINTIIEALAIRGVEARETFDAAGRSYLIIDMAQARAAGLDLATLFEEIAAVMPLPQGHTPPVA